MRTQRLTDRFPVSIYFVNGPLVALFESFVWHIDLKQKAAGN
jgi:sRNA-binding regulator protein Hfq